MHDRRSKKKLKINALTSIKSQKKIQEQTISPRTLWGKIIVYLREHNNLILHIVCGDITDVGMENGKFIIRTQHQNIIDMLNEPENFNKLKQAFEFFGYNNFEIHQSERQKTNEDNINILKKYFDDKLKIINKEN